MKPDEEAWEAQGGKALAVVQARMSSSRLPGKTLRKMAGVPMLERVLDRVAGPEMGAEVVVATSDDNSDDPIAELCAHLGVACVRGDLDDVLSRFVRVLDRFDPPLVVRLTGDNPMVDARAVRTGVTAYREQRPGADVVGVSNHLEERTDPYGYCVEVFRSDALRELHTSDLKPQEREHVTLGFVRRASFRYTSYSILPGDQRLLRWTVDTAEDFRYMERLFDSLGSRCTAERAVRWSNEHPHPSGTGSTAERLDPA